MSYIYTDCIIFERMSYLINYVILFIFISIILLMLLKPFLKIYNKSLYQQHCIFLYNSCSIKVLREASTDNTVIFLILSRKFIFQFSNFWVVTVIPNKLTNIVIITFDEESYLFSKQKSKYVLKYNLQINQTEDIVFLNKDYLKVTTSKIVICKYILDLNFSVFVIDPDIVLFKNPFPYILSIKRYDIIAQGETPFFKDISNGFVLYKNNENMKLFFKNLTEDKVFISGKVAFEQGYINDRLFSHQFNLSIYKLPLENYLSGWKLIMSGIFYMDDMLKCI